MGRDSPFDIVDHSLIPDFDSPVLFSSLTFVFGAMELPFSQSLTLMTIAVRRIMLIFVLLPNLLPIHLCQVAPHIDIDY